MRNEIPYRGLAAGIYDFWHEGGAIGDEAFYRTWIEKGGGTALEVACGTGRLLVPYLKAGLDVEGLDASSEMLEICRDKALEEGVEPVLHEVYMQDMDLGRKYRTIYVPFRTFMVLTDLETVRKTLHRFREHLEDGGRLFISLFVPLYRLTAEQDGRWKLTRRIERSDTDEVVLVSESVTNDTVEQVKRVLFRYEVFTDGKLSRTELQEFWMRWYSKHEFAMLLQQAGFRDVFAHGNYTDEEVREGHGEMTFRATN